jgi:hypothetical protein
MSKHNALSTQIIRGSVEDKQVKMDENAVKTACRSGAILIFHMRQTLNCDLIAQFSSI